MSKRQIGTNSKETWRMAGVLEDPRWEKLVMGQATPEEVADLRAWARQSRLARKAWELYRPSFDKEKEALAATLLRTLKQRGKDDKVWRSARLLAMTSGKPEDRRMMSRHQARVRDNSAKPILSGPPKSGDRVPPYLGTVFEKPMQIGSPAASKPGRSPLLGDHQPQGQTQPDSRDYAGTTTSRMAVSKEAFDTWAAVADAIATNPRLEVNVPRHPENWRVIGGSVVGVVALLSTLIAVYCVGSSDMNNADYKWGDLPSTHVTAGKNSVGTSVGTSMIESTHETSPKVEAIVIPSAPAPVTSSAHPLPAPAPSGGSSATTRPSKSNASPAKPVLTKRRNLDEWDVGRSETRRSTPF